MDVNKDHLKDEITKYRSAADFLIKGDGNMDKVKMTSYRKKEIKMAIYDIILCLIVLSLTLTGVYFGIIEIKLGKAHWVFGLMLIAAALYASGCVGYVLKASIRKLFNK